MPELIMLPPDAVWLTDEQAAHTVIGTVTLTE